jgi:hypothetical protein
MSSNLTLVLTVLFRLWAEVFHVSSSGAGTVKWQQVSEDLVPVNITCIQDSPECVFHITAYNSQVDKILDVRLLQPGKYMQTRNDHSPNLRDPLSLSPPREIDVEDYAPMLAPYIIAKPALESPLGAWKHKIYVIYE